MVNQFVHRANMSPFGFVDLPALLGKEVYLTQVLAKNLNTKTLNSR